MRGPAGQQPPQSALAGKIVPFPRAGSTETGHEAALPPARAFSRESRWRGWRPSHTAQARSDQAGRSTSSGPNPTDHPRRASTAAATPALAKCRAHRLPIVCSGPAAQHKGCHSAAGCAALAHCDRPLHPRQLWAARTRRLCPSRALAACRRLGSAAWLLLRRGDAMQNLEASAGTRIAPATRRARLPGTCFGPRCAPWPAGRRARHAPDSELARDALHSPLHLRPRPSGGTALETRRVPRGRTPTLAGSAPKMGRCGGSLAAHRSCAMQSRRVARQSAASLPQAGLQPHRRL